MTIRDPFRDQARLLSRSLVRTVVDAGAYRGDTVATYASLFADAGIWAFEPTPESYAALANRFGSDPRVRTVEAALWDRAGAVALHAFQSPAGNSLLPLAGHGDAWSDVPAGLAEVSTTTVRAETLDAFCEGNGIASIDVLKLDLQGGELRALQGAARLLAAQAIRLIYAEVLFVPIYQGQTWFHDLQAYLTAHGYRLYNLYGPVHAPDGRLKWADALWMNAAVDDDLRTREDLQPDDPVGVTFEPDATGVTIRMRVNRAIADATAVQVAVNSAPDGSWSGDWSYLTADQPDDHGETLARWDTGGYPPGTYRVAVNLHLRTGETIWWGDQPHRLYQLQ